MKERIQKVLATAGYCSRRKAEELIGRGKVTVNGHPASIGDKMDPMKDIVAVSGQRVFIKKHQQKLYFALNKPRGYVTTMSDEHDRRCVADLVADVEERLYPVGRLDKDSEGLLIMTNDGSLANLVSHPSRGVTKVYRVSVSPKASEFELSKIASGQMIDGEFMQPKSLRVTGEGPDRSVIEMSLAEGKNREIRKICEAAGLNVTRLKRTSIGPIRLGNLVAGKKRELTGEELLALRQACKKPPKKR